MEKIKVVEFITSLGEGGAQSLVKDYAMMLNKEQFDVSVFCIFPIFESGPGQLVKQNKIVVNSVYPKYNKIYSFVNKLFGCFIVPFMMKRHFKRFKPDCLHAHLAVLKYLPKLHDVLPKNILYTCHSEPLKNFKSTSSEEFKSAQYLVKHNGLKIIALHRQMQQQLNQLFGIQNSVVVYNGIDIERFKTVVESKSEIRRTLGLSDDDLVIGHVGRFTYPKNHTFIIDIFHETYKKNQFTKLLLVGTGELKKHIMEKVTKLQIADRVIFLDQRSDINRLLKSMDVFLFPSIYEGLPVSLIEAQAAGLKCVTSTNVTEEAFLTPKLFSLSLDESVEIWANVVLSSDMVNPKPYNVDLRTFEMKEDIKVLESLYKIGL